MNKVEQRKQLILQLGKNYHSKCYICNSPDSHWKKRRGFTFHHLQYDRSEKTHSSFPKTSEGKLDYMIYLAPIILKFEKRFMYLCNKCHYALTSLIKYSESVYKRLLRARQKSVESV